MIALAERLAGVSASPMITLAARVARLRAEGRDVVGLTAGEPDLSPPPHVLDAVRSALARGDTHYTAPEGTAALRRAVSAKLARENGLAYAAGEILIGTGAKQLVYALAAATIDPGDEVITPVPYFPAYVDCTRLHGGVPVPVRPADGGLHLRPDDLAAAITPRTKWLVLNGPGNPSGAAYDEDALAALGEVLLARPHVGIISDEIYEHLLFDGRRHASIAAVVPRLRERTLVLNGVSKAYAMTGFRIGYAAGPAPLIEAMMRIVSHCTSCTTSLGQAAAVAALDGPQDGVAAQRDFYQSRRDRLVEALSTVPGLRCPTPEGALYAFPDCSDLFGRRTPEGTLIGGAAELADWLVTQGVAVVPGEAFGTASHLRATFAAPDDDISEAAVRLRAACARLC